MSVNFLDSLMDDIKFASFDDCSIKIEEIHSPETNLSPLAQNFDDFLKQYISEKEKHPQYKDNDYKFDITSMDVIIEEESQNEIVVTTKDHEQFVLKIDILDENENLLVKHKVQKYSCVICNLQFNNKFNLDRHFNSQKHAANESEFIDLSDLIEEETPDEIDVKFNTAFCKECLKMFKNPYQLKVHQQTVHRSFKCKKCCRGFKNEKELLLHMDRHSKEELFRCQHCGKKFTNNTNMRRHEKLHLNAAKIFGCGVCGKTFNQKTNLQRHEKTHK